jgi:hypothetical protein
MGKELIGRRTQGRGPNTHGYKAVYSTVREVLQIIVIVCDVTCLRRQSCVVNVSYFRFNFVMRVYVCDAVCHYGKFRGKTILSPSYLILITRISFSLSILFFLAIFSFFILSL